MSLREERARRRNRMWEAERAPDARVFRLAEVGSAFNADQQRTLREAIGPAAPVVLPRLADLVVNRWTGPAPDPSPNYKQVEARFTTLSKALRACVRAVEAIGLDGATAAEEAHAFDREPWLKRARARSAQRFADDGAGARWLLAVEARQDRQDQWFDDLGEHLRSAGQTIERGLPQIHAHHCGRARGLRGKQSAIAEDRRWLAFYAARIFTQADLPIRKSASSVFAEVLRVLYQATGLDNHGKHDVFRDVAWVIERRRKMADDLAKLVPLRTKKPSR